MIVGLGLLITVFFSVCCFICWVDLLQNDPLDKLFKGGIGCGMLIRDNIEFKFEISQGATPEPCRGGNIISKTQRASGRYSVRGFFCSLAVGVRAAPLRPDKLGYLGYTVSKVTSFLSVLRFHGLKTGQRSTGRGNLSVLGLANLPKIVGSVVGVYRKNTDW